MQSVGMMTPDFNMHTDPPTPNGCAYYRMALPAQQLADRGVSLVFGVPVFHNEWGYGIQEGDGGFFGFDVAVFKLMMHANVAHTFELMRKRDQRVIVDVDDFHYGLTPENVAFDTTNPRRNAQSNRMYYEIGIRSADRVTVSTGYLADFYEARHRNVVLVRNGIDAVKFDVIEQPEFPTYGWVGGTLWRSGDVELLANWLPSFVKDRKVKVQHAGHIPGDSKHFGARVGLKRVDTKPMVPLNDYPTLFNDIHVGFVPLNLVPFSEAKSYLKGLEYAASGIPFIASPTHEYRLLHEAGVGRLAATPDEWRDHATELLDRDVRFAEAERQREIVMREFDISRRGDEWFSALLG